MRLTRSVLLVEDDADHPLLLRRALFWLVVSQLPAVVEHEVA